MHVTVVVPVKRPSGEQVSAAFGTLGVWLGSGHEKLNVVPVGYNVPTICWFGVQAPSGKPSASRGALGPLQPGGGGGGGATHVTPAVPVHTPSELQVCVAPGMLGCSVDTVHWNAAVVPTAYTPCTGAALGVHCS